MTGSGRICREERRQRQKSQQLSREAVIVEETVAVTVVLFLEVTTVVVAVLSGRYASSIRSSEVLRHNRTSSCTSEIRRFRLLEKQVK